MYTHFPLQAQSTNVYVAVQNEVYWGIRKHCHCTYPVIQNIRLNSGYFTCASGGYITFRAHLYSTDLKTDPADFKSALTTWLYGHDTDKTITIFGSQYSVEPGPCGVAVPHLYAPKCDTPKTKAAPTVCNLSYGSFPHSGQYGCCCCGNGHHGSGTHWTHTSYQEVRA